MDSSEALSMIWSQDATAPELRQLACDTGLPDRVRFQAIARIGELDGRLDRTEEELFLSSMGSGLGVTQPYGGPVEYGWEGKVNNWVHDGLAKIVRTMISRLSPEGIAHALAAIESADHAADAASECFDWIDHLILGVGDSGDPRADRVMARLASDKVVGKTRHREVVAAMKSLRSRRD